MNYSSVFHNFFWSPLYLYINSRKKKYFEVQFHKIYTKYYFLCSAMFSLGLLLDGILFYIPNTTCYHDKLIWALFIVPIIISFYSILGLAIERFQTFALYQQDRRKLTRGFSIVWSVASWTLAICLLVILLSKISYSDNTNTRNDEG